MIRYGWRRLLPVCVAATVIAVLFGAWAWSERVMLVNALLLRMGGALRVQIAALDWEDGALHARGLHVVHAPTAHSVANLSHFVWKPTWPLLWRKNLGAVRLEGGSVDAPLSVFTDNSGGDGAAASSTWRLDTLELAPATILLRDEDGTPLWSALLHGRLHGGTLDPTFDLLDLEATNITWRNQSVASQATMKATVKNGTTKLTHVSIRGGRAVTSWAGTLMPLPLEGEVEIEWEARDMAFSHGGLERGGAHQLHLKNLRLQPRNGHGLIQISAVDAEVSHEGRGRWRLLRGTVQTPEIKWTRDLEAALLSPSSSSSEAESDAALRIEALKVLDGKVQLEATERCPVAGGFAWSAELSALDFSAQGVSSSQAQRVELSGVEMRWQNTAQITEHRPFIALKKAEIILTPNQWMATRKVDSLHIAGMNLRFTPENGPWFDRIDSPPQPVSTEIKPWQRVNFGDLSVSDGSVAVALHLAERMEAESKFEIATKAAEVHLRVKDAQARIPRRAELPVLRVDNAEVVARLPEMWSRRHVESVKLRGGQVEVGNALMTLFSGDAATAGKKMKAAQARWSAGKVEVEALGVTLLNIAPGLPPVRFDAGFTADETPLDLDGLAENVEPQHIDLTRLRIPSPYEPLRTVAEMDLIRVDYTLDGLLHRRIDRVEIISPLLYVGEDLFWYVENYRKFIDGEAPKPDASVGPPAPPDPVAPGWHVDTLAVSDGRLVLAPKGVPLAGFSRPFPFSFTSKLESGQLDAVFDIPSDNYTLKNLKMEFRGMRGHVHFNLPMKDRNNNLTETFTMEQFRWKDLHMEKAHLSVTYDVKGVYGTFGGEAYGGYLNGAFDVYLDDAFTWDGWLAGTDVALAPVTRALFPGYLLLDGKASGKLIATGDMDELYQGDAEFRSRSKGRFRIQALNDAIASLPPALKGDVADQIRRIGLETLRDFDYERIEGKARFHGREGRGHLRFSGPQGARNLEVNVYDHRWREEPRKSDVVRTQGGE